MRIFLIFFFLIKFQYLGAVEFLGKFEQGAFILGKTNPNSEVKIDNKNIRVSKDGYFAFGLDRDRKNNVLITIKNDGETKKIEKAILRLGRAFLNAIFFNVYRGLTIFIFFALGERRTYYLPPTILISIT